MIYFSAVGMMNALGNSVDDIAANLQRGFEPGIGPNPKWMIDDHPCWVGEVRADLPEIPPSMQAHNSRNNRLLLSVLEQIRHTVDEAISRYGAGRIAVVLGTSTSGIDEGDQTVSAHEHGEATDGYFYELQEMGDSARFLAAWLGLSGPAYTISTACSSSLRAIISGRRLIEAGLADVALVGGADSLSRVQLHGFHSLESLSAQQCHPFSQERNGINIGEGATLMLLTREPHDIALLGVGESSDAWHMSAPHPEGTGAEQAIRMALQESGLEPHDIGYINLHGTATPLNDKMEAQVIHRIFGDAVPCSSTKHLTGHTLGAAGALEVGLCWLLLSRNLPLPAQDFSESTLDPLLPVCGLLTEPAKPKRRTALSNSFAFGGNNACLVIGAVNE